MKKYLHIKPVLMVHIFFPPGLPIPDTNSLRALREELDRNNLKRLFVGHWWNEDQDFGYLDGVYAKKYYGTAVRLDRSHIKSSDISLVSGN